MAANLRPEYPAYVRPPFLSNSASANVNVVHSADRC